MSDVAPMHKRTIKRACSGLDSQNVATRRLKIKYSDRTDRFKNIRYQVLNTFPNIVAKAGSYYNRIYNRIWFT